MFRLIKAIIKATIKVICLPRLILMNMLIAVISLVLPLLLILQPTAVFAQINEAADTQANSVEQFQQWLREQDEQNQQAVANAITSPDSAANQPAGAATAMSANSSNPADISAQAFDALKQQTMPMTPAQIKEFKRLVEQTQRVSAATPGTPPKPVSSTLIVNLAPGVTPPAIRLSQGFISSLVFVDSSGAPWPITAYDLGNAQAFNIQWDKVSNILMLQPLKAYTYANLAVRLKGLATPVMLTLIPGQAQVDYRVDLRVAGIGPNGTQPSNQMALPTGTDQALLSVLDGIPPAGSKPLDVKGVQGQAWVSQAGDKMYLRLHSTVLSPGWVGHMSSPDGTQAYELPRTSTVLISFYNKPVEIQLEEPLSE